MKKVTITQLKDNLSALLAQAARGEEVLVFDRKKPYVRLVGLFGDLVERPTARQSKSDIEIHLTRLEAEGLLVRSRRRSLATVLKRKRPTARESVVTAVIEERDREL